MLRGSVEDISLIGGYLHDGYFKPSGIAYDREHRRFSMILDRIWYEHGERGKFLFLIPVIRFPWMRSVLELTGVVSVDQRLIDRGVDGPAGEQLLMHIVEEEDGTIEIASTHIEIRLTISHDTEIVLEDREPVDRPKAVDFFKCIFRSLPEVEKLREDR